MDDPTKIVLAAVAVLSLAFNVLQIFLESGTPEVQDWFGNRRAGGAAGNMDRCVYFDIEHRVETHLFQQSKSSAP
jgi:hypothetical protein